MRYLLVVGFSCDVYTREPQARIFVGNILLDEFCVKHSVIPEKKLFSKFISKKNILEPFPNDEVSNFVVKTLPDLKFYEIELHKSIDSLSIHVDIQNNDNNFNNGFMSKNTCLTLEVCDFFPLNNELMNKLTKYKRKNILLNYSWHRKENIGQNIIFHLAKNGMKWQGKNGQTVDAGGEKLNRYSLGGDGTFTCNLIKKYGILITKNAKPYRFNFNAPILNYFSNKYQQYAN